MAGGSTQGDVKDMSYYGKCMMGGALACGLTHTIVTPLDLVKCRRQVDPTLYASTGAGFKTIYAQEGLAGLFTVSISTDSRDGDPPSSVTIFRESESSDSMRFSRPSTARPKERNLTTETRL